MGTPELARVLRGSEYVTGEEQPNVVRKQPTGEAPSLDIRQPVEDRDSRLRYHKRVWRAFGMDDPFDVKTPWEEMFGDVFRLRL